MATKRKAPRVDELLARVQRTVDMAILTLTRGTWPRGEPLGLRNRALRQLHTASDMLEAATGVVFDLVEEDVAPKPRRTAPKRRARRARV